MKGLRTPWTCQEGPQGHADDAASHTSPLLLERRARHACFPDVGKIVFHEVGKPAKEQV